MPLEGVEPLINNAYALLSFPHTEIQKWAYRHISMCVSQPIVQAQANPDSEEASYQLPEPHLALLSESIEWQRIFDSVEEHSSGDFQYLHEVFGYLLAWNVLIDHLRAQTAQVRSLGCGCFYLMCCRCEVRCVHLSYV